MAGERHIIPITVVANGDFTALRRSLDSELGSFRSQILAAADRSPKTRALTAQRVIGTQEADYLAQIKTAEKSGTITSKAATEARAVISQIFDELRREVASALKLEKINPATPKQLRSAEDREARRLRETADQVGGRQAPPPPPKVPPKKAPTEEETFRTVFGGNPRTTLDALLRGIERDFTPRREGDPTSVGAAENAEIDGVGEALRRFYGLLVGYNQALTESQPVFSQSLQTLRGMVTAQRAYQTVLEQTAEERAILEKLQSTGEQDLFQATSALAEARERRALREGDARREGRAGLVDERGAARRADQLDRAKVEVARIRGGGTADEGLAFNEEQLRALARLGIAREDMAAALRLERDSVGRSEEQTERLAGARRAGRVDDATIEDRALAGMTREQINALARLGITRDEMAAALTLERAAVGRSTQSIERSAAAENFRAAERRQINDARRRQFEISDGAGGSFFQRAQAYIARRQGQAPRSVDDYQTGRQFLASKVLTTGGFALSGGLLYGAINLGGDVLRQSTELQQQLSLIRTQFRETGEAAAGISFEKYRRELAETSRETGVAGDEVANVQRQLAGAFADDQGNLNFARASTEGTVALKYSKTSKLPQQEITDSYTAVALAFRDDEGVPLGFERIADLLVVLENRFGVLGPEILKFTADLAPLGEELGFTVDQLAGLGAVAQKASGKSGQVLAEQLGRILPEMKAKATELFNLFNENQATAPAADSLLDAFAGGDSARALSILVENYDKLNKAQRNTLASLVGGARQASTFYALLNQSADTLRVLDPNAATDNTGAFDARWRSYKETVTANVEQMRRAVEELGQLIFDAGADDFLSGLADGAKFAAVALGALLKLVGELNDLLGGMPARAAGLLAVAKAFSLARGAAAGKLGIDAAAGWRQSLGARAISAGGFLSPYRAMPQAIGPDGQPIIGPAAGTPALRWSTGLAASSNFNYGRFIGKDWRLQNVLNRTSEGQVAPGAGTAAGSALAAAAPVLATLAVTMLLDEISKVKAQINEQREDLRTKIAAEIEKGVSPEELRNRIGDAGSASGIGEFFGNLLGINIDANEQAAEIIAEEAARRDADTYAQIGDVLAQQDADRIARINQALKGDNAAQGAKDLAALLGGSGTRGVDITAALDREGSDEAKRILLEAAGVKITQAIPGDRVRPEDPFLQSEQLQALAQRIRDNPTDVAAQEALQLIVDSGALDAKTATSVNNLLDALADGKLTDAELADATKVIEGNAEDQQAYAARLAALKASYAAGTGGSVDQIAALIRPKIAEAKASLATLKEGGNVNTPEYAALQNQLTEFQNDLEKTIVDDADALRRIADDVAERSGRSPFQVAQAKVVNAKVRFDAIAGEREADIATKAAAARDLLDAQAEEFDQALASATSQEEFNRILNEGIARDPYARKLVIAEGLSVGSNAEAIDRLADVLGLSTGQTRSKVAAAIAAANGVNENIDIAVATARRNQLRAALDAISSDQVVGKDISLAAFEGSGANELSEIEAALRDLFDIDLAALDPGGSERGTAADRLSAAQARASAEADLARARAGNDAVAAAEATVADAKRQLELVKQNTPEDYNAITAAQAAVESAELQLGNVIRSRAQALRQASFDLQRVGAFGNAAALAQIDIAAARAQIDAATTPEEAAAGQVALAQGYLASRQAAIAQEAARGQYLATLLAGDPEAQARQQLANAQQALNSSTADNRYSAMAAVVEAQRALQNAITEGLTAQIDVAIAVAEGGGETVKIALLQLQQAQIRFDAAKAAGLGGAQLDAAKADLIRAQTNATNVARQDRLSDLDYLLEFDKITAGEYIKMLQAELATIPESNKDLRREIERKIKGIRDEMGANSSFNIPDIVLPTLYEARRLNQAQTWANSSVTTVNDNRNIQIILPNVTDPAGAVRAVSDALSSPPRTGAENNGVWI